MPDQVTLRRNQQHSIPQVVLQQFEQEITEQLLPAFLKELDLQSLGPKPVVDVLCASAKAGQQLDAALTQQLVKQVVLALPQARITGAAKTLWAAAKLKQQPTQEQLQKLISWFGQLAGEPYERFHENLRLGPFARIYQSDISPQDLADSFLGNCYNEAPADPAAG